MSYIQQLPIEFRRTAPITSRSPWRILWLILGVLFLLLIRTPFLGILFLPRTFRHSPRWSWKQAMMVKLMNFHYSFTVGLRPQFTADAQPGRWSGPPEFFELIKPASFEKSQGVLANANIQPAPRPGAWWPAKYDAKRDRYKRVILYFMGGAYVSGGHLPSMYSTTVEPLCRELDAIFFSVGYRLASTRGNQFPAQLQDAVAAYRHLLDKGIEPRRIVLLGDSAGANLALALLRYISQVPAALPKPAAAILPSPWVDLSLDLKILKRHRSYTRDSIRIPVLQWGVDAFIPGDMDPTDPYISPGLHPFHIPVPTLILADSAEVLFDSIEEFTNGLGKFKANRSDLYITEHGIHDTFMFGMSLGFNRHAQEQFVAAKKFLQRHKV